jgi:flagellar motility protein MotE (MotC chaperone)
MMMKHLSTTLLFVTIGLLLGAKAGLSIWHGATADNQPHSLQVAQQSPEPVLSQHSATPQSETVRFAIIQTATAVTPHGSRQGAGGEPVLPATETAPVDSWGALAAYLIPAARAASDLSQGAPVIEDKTLTSLRRYREQLEQRTKALDTREQTLKQAEKQLQQRIAELEQLEASIQQRLADESKVKNKKIKRLTAVYEGMKPDKAAPVIAKMELATVVKVFLLMDEKKVGKILSFLPPEKAVRISQALTRRISSVR